MSFTQRGMMIHYPSHYLMGTHEEPYLLINSLLIMKKRKLFALLFYCFSALQLLAALEGLANRAVLSSSSLFPVDQSGTLNQNPGIINVVKDMAQVVVEPRLYRANKKEWYVTAAQGTDNIEVGNGRAISGAAGGLHRGRYCMEDAYRCWLSGAGLSGHGELERGGMTAGGRQHRGDRLVLVFYIQYHHYYVTL